jgi:hypothetical protein
MQMRFYPEIRRLFLLNFILLSAVTILYLVLAFKNSTGLFWILFYGLCALLNLWAYLSIYWDLAPTALESRKLWIRKSFLYTEIKSVRSIEPKWFNRGTGAVEVVNNIGDSFIIWTTASDKLLPELRILAPQAGFLF